MIIESLTNQFLKGLLTWATIYVIYTTFKLEQTIPGPQDIKYAEESKIIKQRIVFTVISWGMAAGNKGIQYLTLGKYRWINMWLNLNFIV